MGKFEDKNKEVLTQLTLMLEDADVKGVITSIELYHYLSTREGFSLLNEEYLRYNNKRIISDPYLPTYSLYPLKLSEMLSFNVPCLCGIYKDEKHP